MQRPNEKRRKAIADAALKLFATHPFHEVRLEDVASAARVGKGTVYVYFRGKDDLYFSLIREGFAQSVDRLRDQLAHDAGISQLFAAIVREVVAFAHRFPHFYQLMRTGALPPNDARLLAKRKEMTHLIEGVIRKGIRRGEMADPRPELTAEYLLASVRGAMLFGPAEVNQEQLAGHLLRVIGHGIFKKES